MSSRPPFPTLHTPRLLLREIVDADAPTILRIHGDAQVMRWMGADPPRDLAAAQTQVKVWASWRAMANPGTRWGIQNKDTGHLIGTCGLFSWNRSWRKCNLGYELAPDSQGQGYMRETLRTVVPWGFEHMKLNRVEALIHPDNVPSIKLVEALGFAGEGRMRQLGYWGGQHHDMLQFALLAQDWVTQPAMAVRKL